MFLCRIQVQLDRGQKGCPLAGFAMISIMMLCLTGPLTPPKNKKGHNKIKHPIHIVIFEQKRRPKGPEPYTSQPNLIQTPDD